MLWRVESVWCVQGRASVTSLKPTKWAAKFSCFCLFRRSRSRPVPRRPHQRLVRPWAPGERQGGHPANHLTGAPQAASWSASSNQHQVSEVEVLPGETSQVKVLRLLSERERLIYDPSLPSDRCWPRCRAVQVRWPSLSARCSSAVETASATPTLTAAWSLHWACSVFWRPSCDAADFDRKWLWTWPLHRSIINTS